jgi:glycosyltransferase involved in cell wall biosynthesis
MAARNDRILFAFWGRRGAMSRFTLDLARTLRKMDLDATVSISTGNELYDEIAAVGVPVLPVETFASALGAVTRFDRFLSLRHCLGEAIEHRGLKAVVMLMPHVWSPFLAPSIADRGARYAVIVHDGDPHPGDPTALATNWLLRDVRRADRVITLSRHVADRLRNRLKLPSSQVTALFHPLVDYGQRPKDQPPRRPLRVLFFGRVMPYKGLPLLVEAAEILRERGIPIALGVVGEGDLGSLAPRLARLGAEVENRWVAHDEIPTILADYDVMALPYVEASQSGAASAALGFGMPMVATPVGGLKEQVDPGRTGLLAEAATAEALAEALARLVQDEALYVRLAEGVAAARESLSMRRFITSLTDVVLS